jgi:hypothetical protein
MSVVTGSVKLQSSISESLAAGATRAAQVTVPLSLESTTTYTDGSAANMVNDTYYFSGSAAGTPTTINLSTIVCTDGTVGLTYIREIIIANDATNSAYTLIYGGGTTPFTPELAGTTPTEIIQPGTAKRVVSKPLGTTGHVVSTAVNVKLDPGANTVAFRIWIFGSN